MHLYHEPLAREIGQPLPMFTTLNKYYTILQKNIKLTGHWNWTLFKKYHGSIKKTKQLTMSMKCLVFVLSILNIVPCRQEYSALLQKRYSLGCISLTTSIACTAQIFEVGRGWFVVSKRYITSLVSIRYLSMKYSFRPPLRWGQMQHKIKQNNGTYQYFCVHVFLNSQLNYKKTTEKKKKK